MIPTRWIADIIFVGVVLGFCAWGVYFTVRLLAENTRIMKQAQHDICMQDKPTRECN